MTFLFTLVPAYIHAFFNILVGALTSRVPPGTAECPLYFTVAGVMTHAAFTRHNAGSLTRLGRVTGRQGRAEAEAGGDVAEDGGEDGYG